MLGLLADGAALAEVALTGVLTLLLAQVWSPAHATAWNAPGGSLSVEALFHLAFPLLLPPLARWASRRGAGGLAAGLAAAYALCVLPVLAWRALRGGGSFGANIAHPLLHLPQFLRRRPRRPALRPPAAPILDAPFRWWHGNLCLFLAGHRPTRATPSSPPSALAAPSSRPWRRNKLFERPLRRWLVARADRAPAAA